MRILRICLLLASAFMLGGCPGHVQEVSDTLRIHRTKIARVQPAPPPIVQAPVWSSGGNIISVARSHIGKTAGQLGLKPSLWCGRFMDLVLRESGRKGGSAAAKHYLHYGPRTIEPQVGSLAILTRGDGGHVGVVTAVDAAGNPTIISGNHNNRVAEAVYPKRRVIAYVLP
jgi:uncharacterized protein (TIGR02594 family)